jgi:anti-sigma-K factor RskA
VSAGTFRPGPAGSAQVSARYDLPPDSLRAIAVTEEPAGGVPAPTGEVVVSGAFST